MASVLVDGVTMRRGETTMLDDVTLEVNDRELLVVLGPSGAGKSALLRIVAGSTIRPSSKRKRSASSGHCTIQAPHPMHSLGRAISTMRSR